MAVSNEELLKNIDSWAKLNLGPDFQFREHQKENILKIVSGIVNDTCANQVIEAPTGSGKSIIIIVSAGVLAHFYSLTSYILCSDLFLWDQYKVFIDKNKLGFGTIMGQTGNYMCPRTCTDIKNAECRMARIPWKTLFDPTAAIHEGYKCACACEYVLNRKKCKHAQVVLMTYQLFLYQMNIINNCSENPDKLTFQKKDIIFCDECHNIPDIIQQKYSPTIAKEDLSKIASIYDYAVAHHIKTEYDRKYSTGNELLTYLFTLKDNMADESLSTVKDFEVLDEYTDILYNLAHVVNEIQNKSQMILCSRKKLTKAQKEAYWLSTYYQNYMCYMNDFFAAINATGAQYLVKQVNKNEKGEISIAYHCAKEDVLVSHFLLENAQWRVMLSATVGGKDAFFENIGEQFLADRRTEFSVIPSTFDFSKSRIVIDDSCNFTYANRFDAFKQISKKTYDLVRKHAGQRGVIHTGSYQNAARLIQNAPRDIRDRLIGYDTSRDKKTAINDHKLSSDSVLVGPTLCEGIDLPDDQCRFIITMKVPFPSLADKLVKAKKDLFPKWYASKASNSIIQGIGRGIRHKADWCKSYILDGCFDNLIYNTQDQYPEEFKDRLISIEEDQKLEANENSTI